MDKPVLLTRDGLAKLEHELEELRTVRRSEVAERIKYAKDFGDISENAEYDEAKNEQGMLEGRILVIENMLRNAVIIEKGSESGIISVGTSHTAPKIHLVGQLPRGSGHCGITASPTGIGCETEVMA